MLYWYVYQLDSRVFGNNWATAPGCSGCDFDTFINFIQKPKGVSSSVTTPVGDNPEPDVIEIANWLQDYGYKAAADPSKLFADLDPGATLAATLEKAANRIVPVKAKLE